MELLYLLEKIRTPFLDKLFTYITMLGEEAVIIAAMLCVLWCVDKYYGRMMLFTGVFGITLNGLLKVVFAADRPWVIDSSFTIVESARASATGFSFPSGHTANAAFLFWCLALYVKNKALKIVFSFIPFAVAFSRMYLGVHTPLDVGVSLAISAVLSLLCFGFYKRYGETLKPSIIISLSVIAFTLIAYIVYYILGQTKFSAFPSEFITGFFDLFKIIGLSLSMPVIFLVDYKYIKYIVGGSIMFRIIMLIAGTAAVIAVKELLKIVLEAILPPAFPEGLIRYFFVGLVGGLLIPAIFEAIRKKKEV